ncbi:unnamed protein product [Rhodiola kirilowii]
MASFFKVHEADQLTRDAHLRRSRRRIAVIAISSIVLVSVVIAAVVGTAVHNQNNKEERNTNTGLSSSIKAVCDVTLHPELCYERLGSEATEKNKTSPQDLFILSIQVALTELTHASQTFKTGFTGLNDTVTNAALESCKELLEMTADHLNDSLSVPTTSLTQAFDDLETWLSTAGTCQETCLDGFIDVNENLRTELTALLKNSTELTSNSLAIVSWISSVADSVKFGQRRRLFSEGEWVNRIDRELIESVDLRKKANLVVAADGSGKYKTIGAALKAVPDKSTKQTVIYVKKGTYAEKVVVTKSKWNVVFVGDGMDATIVIGSLNVVDGTPTFTTAPFIVQGKGLVARDMGFRNTAGPAKHQAVAMRSSGDFSVFYRCKFDAYQDTLYPHVNRQFYKECTIIGTVDFIFGNSAAVFQNCNILPRLPSSGQQNTITAQGKSDPNQNTGLSFQNCNIAPFNNLGSTATYLGRPWKVYSTTVFMNSVFGSLINPKGWLPWTGTSAPSTIFYAEYQNTGPGASTKNRVKWTGLKTITAATANKFTVNSFIAGSKWITAAGVPFKGGL